MKKRLLITSIVMMLVVAVALSTATYAWFTSNTSVTANSVTMTAGTSGSSALGIAWAASSNDAGTPAFNNDYGTYISPYSFSGALQPAAPSALTDADASFFTAYIDAQGKFKSPVSPTDVFRFANKAPANNSDGDYSNLIHVANLAQSGTIGVELTAKIDPIYEAVAASTDRGTTDWYTENDGTYTLAGNEVTNSGTETTYYVKNDATDLVRIAVFEVSGANYTYKGLLSKTAAVTTPTPVPNTAVGEIGSGNTASALITASSTTSIQLSNIAAQTDQAYAVYVWLDGALFDEAESGKKATVELTFTATAAA